MRSMVEGYLLISPYPSPIRLWRMVPLPIALR